jgi:hypothetical protein
MPLSLHKFYFDAIMRGRETGERYGQAMFNQLTIARPELAAQVRGTDRDPFYVSRLDDPRWDKFVEHIESRWFMKTRATSLEIPTPSVLVPHMPRPSHAAMQAVKSEE